MNVINSIVFLVLYLNWCYWLILVLPKSPVPSYYGNWGHPLCNHENHLAFDTALPFSSLLQSLVDISTCGCLQGLDCAMLYGTEAVHCHIMTYFVHRCDSVIDLWDKQLCVQIISLQQRVKHLEGRADVEQGTHLMCSHMWCGSQGHSNCCCAACGGNVAGASGESPLSDSVHLKIRLLIKISVLASWE